MANPGNKTYHVYWHWDSRINTLEHCSESKAYAKYYSIHKGASRIIVHNNSIIESAGPTNQYKYMLAAQANYNGKLSIPKNNGFYVVNHWGGCNHKYFASNKRDEAMIYYGSIHKGASRAVISNGAIIHSDGPSNDWKKAAIGWMWFK